jgi:hypothetical protein
VPSTAGNKFLEDRVEVGLDNLSYTIDVYDTQLGSRWLEALEDNLRSKRILEKNFCFLGFADSKRDLNYLVRELNKNIEKINCFQFSPVYKRIDPFSADDFQYSDNLPIGRAINGDKMSTPGKRLKHESCNLLHQVFRGTTRDSMEYFKLL